MCRFNIVYAKNDELGILAQNGYTPFDENYPGYTGYVRGYCNCGSFVGSMAESDRHFQSYEEMRACERKEKLEVLIKVRELMHRPDYAAIRDAYIQERDALLDAMFAMTEEVGDFETEQMELLNEKYDFSPPADLVEKLYDEVEVRHNAICETAPYKEIEQRLEQLRKRNPVLEESTFYYLTKEEQYEAFGEGVPLSELLDDEDDETVDAVLSQMMEDADEEDIVEIEFDEPDMVIDDVIEKLENETDEDAETEFQEYIALFEGLLTSNDNILFSTIWSEIGEYNLIDSISLSEMTIDVFAGMNFNDMIRIVAIDATAGCFDGEA